MTGIKLKPECYRTCRKKFLHFDSRIAQGTLERESVNFIMAGKHYPSAVGMFHLHMAAFAVNLHETHSLERCLHLATRQQRKFHNVIATISRFSFAASSCGDGSRYNSIASRMF